MPRPVRGASRSGPASEPGDSAPLSSPGSESCSASSEPGRDLETGIGLSVGPPGVPRSPLSLHGCGTEPAHRAHIWRLHLLGRRRLLPYLLPAPYEAGGIPEGAGRKSSWYCPGRCAATRVESVVRSFWQEMRLSAILMRKVDIFILYTLPWGR